ncbi:hypothetical protein [Lysinibacillus sp. SGAir0095]|uniref:hypothetical protein n=1 Tax=Lysinibacillus sp. SGAir0095 TaxID=2070463 RepID=UPI0010CD2F16|nr:hypothetical protein [Lysinibacillus sp. SGAir0095]QCR31543.1 hypothetical protein C1N55_04880 [Lysinibacillus sp. SGAir0095]
MIREILDIYNRNWSQILFWSILIILPVTMITFLSMIYVSGSENSIAPHYFSGLAIFLNFILCIPPFLKMVIVDRQDETVKPAEGIVFFWKQFGLLLAVSSILYFIAFIGMYLLFIPTIIAFILLIVFPFFSEGPSIREIFYQSAKAIKRENIALIGDILVIVFVNLGIWLIVLLFLEQYDNNLLAYLLIRILVNILVFPIFYIYLTLRFRKNEAILLAAERW